MEVVTMKFTVALSLLFTVAVAFPSADLQWEDLKVHPFEGIEKRIIGGKIASSKQFPYQVRMMLTKRRFGKLVDSLCGGALISNKVILTAAHCLEGAISGTILLGTSNVRKMESTAVTVKVPKESFILHDEWNPQAWRNDIALVKLSTPIQLNDAIKTINLPRASQTDLENRMGVISGFGLIGNSASPPDELRYVERRMLPSRNCEGAYPGRFKSTHVCVDGSYSKSACPGDSGGPLAIDESDGSKTIVGITSFGSANCEMGYPTVYTKVTSYLGWINRHTGIPIRR